MITRNHGSSIASAEVIAAASPTLLADYTDTLYCYLNTVLAVNEISLSA